MAFTVNGPKWKSVRLEGKPGYWIQVDDNDSPIDLDEQGNIRVYSSKTDKNPQFGRIRQIGGIQREQDDKVAADRVRREADERARNSGAWKFANVLSELPSFGMASQVAKGADEFRNGNYVKGAFEMASPMMFGTGALGTAARSAIGTYNLLNSEGIAKTVNLAKQGRYGRAALSGLGDAFNLALSAEGWSPAAKFVNKAMQLGIGKQVQFGNNMYSLEPNYAGINFFKLKKTPTTSQVPLEQPKTDIRSLISDSERFDDYKQIAIEDLQKIVQERLGRRLSKTELADYINRKQVDLTGEGLGYAPLNADFQKEGTVVFREEDLPEAISNLERFLNPNVRKTRFGKERYSDQEIAQMVDENGNLKSDVALQRVESGSHGTSNWHSPEDTKEDLVTKYLQTKYNTGAQMGMLRDNPFDRSGVLVKVGDREYSTDSFKTALDYLERALSKKGRKFYNLNGKGYSRANNYGQKGRYEEILLDPEFDTLMKTNRGELPQDTEVFKLRDGTLAVRQADGKVVMKLKPRTKKSITGGYNIFEERIPGDYDEIINRLNTNYNLNIGYPRINKFGAIEWPNLYGILYKNGGILNR